MPFPAFSLGARQPVPPSRPLPGVTALPELPFPPFSTVLLPYRSDGLESSFLKSIRI